MRGRAGFTLIELLVVLAVVGFLLVLGMRGTSHQTEPAQAAAVAQALGDALQSARSRAQARGAAVGIGLPGRGAFASQGYYVVEGVQAARVTERRIVTEESPAAWISWGVSEGERLEDITTTGRFDLARLGLPEPDDPVIMFLPDGRVLSRGVAFDGRDYHLRVGTRPGGSSDPATLTGLDHAKSIKVNPNGGGISVQPLAGFPADSSTTPFQSTLPPIAGPVTDVPVVDSLTCFPHLTEISPGVFLNLSTEPVTLKLEATSPAGVPLFVRWVKDGGQWSIAEGWLPMTYSEADSRWKASVLWIAPPDPASTYHLSAQVRDDYGNLSSESMAPNLTFTSTLDSWRLVFVSRTTTSLEADLEIVNGDGSGRTVLAHFPTPPGPLVAPDGNLIACGVNGKIELYGIDGTLLHTTATAATNYGPLKWADDSSAVVTGDSESPTKVYTVPADGGPATTLFTLPGQGRVYDATGDLRYFLYKLLADRRTLWLYDRVDSTHSAVFASPPSSYGVTAINFSPSGEYVSFYDQAPGRHHHFRVRRDGSDLLDLGPTGGYPVAFSYNDANMAFVCDNPVEFRCTDINGLVRWSKPGYVGGAFRLDDTTVIATPGGFFTPGLVKIDVATGAETTLLDGSDGRFMFDLNVMVAP